MLQNDPHKATETTESLNCFVLDFCCGGHIFSSSVTTVCDAIELASVK